MSQVVLLSDSVLYGELGSSRYIAPYTLASQLESAGFSTVVIDYFTQKQNFFEFLLNFINSETIIVGISTTFLNPRTGYFEQLRNGAVRNHLTHTTSLWFQEDEQLMDWMNTLKNLLSERCPKARIVLGGTKAVNFCFKPEMGKNVDFFVLGAGDLSLVNLAKAIRDNIPIETVNFNGLKYLNDIGLKNQFDLCPQTHYSRKWAIQKNESLPIEISRGCIFNCKFCYYEKKKSIRKKSSEITDEMIRNYENFGTTVYHFTDDCFNDSREKVETLCNAFLKLPFKLEWISYARVDVAVKFPETADLMVESGASALFWGLESFHVEAARKAGKGTPPDQVKEFLLNFMKKNSTNCFSFGSFIVGLPDEPLESIEESFNWLVNNKALHSAFFGALGLGVFNKSFDKIIVDYADYSRHPEKYGFTKISADATYWKHAQMDSTIANQTAERLNKQWVGKMGNGLLSYIWQYPHFRSLGYSKETLFKDFFSNDQKMVLSKDVADKNTIFLNRYWEQLEAESKNV